MFYWTAIVYPTVIPIMTPSKHDERTKIRAS